MRPTAWRVIVALLATSLGIAGCGPPGSAPRSVLLVTLDTTRWDVLGIYGDPTARTPHLDALGRRGTVFEHALVDVPSTLPSHTTMMTGAVSLRHGVRMNGEFSLPPEARTLAERFREVGHETGGVISSVTLKSVHGIAQGFTRWDETFRAPFRGIDPDLERQSLRHIGTQRRADEVSAVALEMLDAFTGPFLLWVHYVDPHLTYDPPPPWDRVPELGAYGGEIAYTDTELGRVLRRLREDAPDAVIAVVSDHGEGLGEHGQDGHGMFLYESTLRIPFLLAGVRGAAPIVRDLARTADLAPTLEDAAGLDPTPWPDGVGLFAGGEPRERILAESLTPTKSYGGAPIKAVRTADAKYVHAPRPELFDLTADPDELRNLFAADSGRAQDLSAWLASEVARLNVAPLTDDTKAPMDEDQLEAIRALGYIVGRDDRLPDDELALVGLDPKDLIEVVLAHRYVFDERYAEARPRLDRFFRSYPEYPGPGWERLWARAQFALALVEAAEGHQDRVVDRIETAVRLDPTYREAVATLEQLRASGQAAVR